LSEKKSGKRGWIAAAAVVAAAAFGYGAFELGRTSAGYFVVSSMLERLDLRRRNQALDAENDKLRHRVAVAEVAQQVDRQAQSDAQRMMGDLQEETARQKQELQFYRGLVVRQYGSGALRVQELRVVADEEEERRYRVMITLVQATTRDTVANGTVTFSVEGRQGEEPVVLALPDVEVDERKQFPFSLRFFQQIEVPIELPVEFRPERLHVEYRLGRNPEPTKQTFDWRVEGGPEPPAL
jgi:cell division protein FtsB